MSVEEDTRSFYQLLYVITALAVVGLPSVVFIFKYLHIGGGKTGWGKTNGHKSCGLSVAGIFPLLTLWSTALLWLHSLSDDEDENDKTEDHRQSWTLMAALLSAAITKFLSALGHPKMQWWYCKKRMHFVKSVIRSAADVYLIVVTGWEMIENVTEASEESPLLAKLMPHHGLSVVTVLAVLVLLGDLQRFMKDHDRAEKKFYRPGRERSLDGYVLLFNTGEQETSFDGAIDLDVEAGARLLCPCLSAETQKTLSKYLTLNNAVTLVQLWIATLTLEGMVWISCLIKMSSGSELEHDAYIENEEEED